MNLNEKFTLDNGEEPADCEKFRSLVGGLLYLTHTRPDIALSVGIVSRFMQRPSKNHFGAAKRILRYVAGTTQFGIWYDANSDIKLVGYSDSDWASSTEDRKSISAHTFTLGSGAISWSSKKQNATALSSTEAEYIVVATASCQAVWLRRILSELQQKQDEATEILCDNNAATFMTRNPAFHNRTKHIDLKYHFIRELVARNEVVVQHCSTHENNADLLTKSVTKAKFVYFRARLGVCDFGLREGVEK